MSFIRCLNPTQWKSDWTTMIRAISPYHMTIDVNDQIKQLMLEQQHQLRKFYLLELHAIKLVNIPK